MVITYRKAATAFLFLLALGKVSGARVEHLQENSRPDPIVELRSNTATFPLKLAGGRPVVEVRINGKGPFAFILDSGAEGTVVSQSLADELKLEVVGEAMAGTPGSTHPVPVKIVRIGRLELGDVIVSGAQGIAEDFSSLPGLFGGAGAPQGILSIARWKGVLVTLDYPAERIEVRRGELPAADDLQVFEFSANDRLPTVPLNISGVTIRAHIDSGASASIMLPGNLAPQLPLVSKPVEVGRARTMDGEMIVMGAKLNGSVKLGRYTFENPDLRFSDGLPMGNLGYNILRRYSVTIDWNSRRIRLEEPTAPVK